MKVLKILKCEKYIKIKNKNIDFSRKNFLFVITGITKYNLQFYVKYAIIISDVTFCNSVASVAIGNSLGVITQGGKEYAEQ